MNKEHMDAIRKTTRNRAAAPVRDISTLPVYNDVLSLTETAQLLHCSPATVSRLVMEQGLPCRKIGNSMMFSAPAILSWLDFSQETGSEEEEEGEE